MASTAISAAELSLVESKNVDDKVIKIGETLTYSVTLAGFPAGTQIIKVDRKTMLDDCEVYLFTSELRTNLFFTIFYHFYDRKHSFVETDTLFPSRYVGHLEDGDHRAKVEIDFETKSNEAKYIKNEDQKVISIPIGCQDELSMVYFVRSKKFDLQKDYFFPLILSGTVKKVKLSVDREKSLRTVLGTVDTLLLRTSNGYGLWLTDDERRIPVRIEAMSKIGKIVATLSEINFDG